MSISIERAMGDLPRRAGILPMLEHGLDVEPGFSPARCVLGNPN